MEQCDPHQSPPSPSLQHRSYHQHQQPPPQPATPTPTPTPAAPAPVIVDVEVCLNPSSAHLLRSLQQPSPPPTTSTNTTTTGTTTTNHNIRTLFIDTTKAFFASNSSLLYKCRDRHPGFLLLNANNLASWSFSASILQHIEYLRLYRIDDNDIAAHENVAVTDESFHFFCCNEEEAFQEDMDGTDVPSSNLWMLPSRPLDGLWESLIFDSCIKSNLLNYVRTSMLFSARKVDSRIISWNRLVLLHGPPGTGKTSLAKALSHKLAVLLSDTYQCFRLVEVNSHSLFSKWFSESGKLVLKLFAYIQELAEDPSCLVCVLVDEVESLSCARKAGMSGGEPSDAIRVVNALLTQLDKLKYLDNVLVITTSNITGAIDLAFIDRADIKQYIGLPSVEARYAILSSCVNELMRTTIITPRLALLSYPSIVMLMESHNQHNIPANDEQRFAIDFSQNLVQVCSILEGCSGRTLRRLPFLASAFILQRQSSCSPSIFIQTLAIVAERELKSNKSLDVTMNTT